MTKAQEMAKLKKQNERLLNMLCDAREKEKGYQEISKVHTAYIAVLLKKLGATSEETAISITDAETKEALANYETRGAIDNGVWKLFAVEKD